MKAIDWAGERLWVRLNAELLRIGDTVRMFNKAGRYHVFEVEKGSRQELIELEEQGFRFEVALSFDTKGVKK